MKKGDKYFAYTQQGTILQASNIDCRRLIDDGDRPFNYFKVDNPQSYTATDNVPVNSEKETNEVTL